MSILIAFLAAFCPPWANHIPPEPPHNPGYHPPAVHCQHVWPGHPVVCQAVDPVHR